MECPIRPARQEDVPAISQLVAPYVVAKILLPRSDDELNQLIPDGFVAEDGNRIVGFAAIEVYSKKLAEILCLAVSPDHQGHGLGKRLVRRCLDRARDRGVLEVMAISRHEEFLRQCGFDFALPDQKKAMFYQLGEHRSWGSQAGADI